MSEEQLEALMCYVDEKAFYLTLRPPHNCNDWDKEQQSKKVKQAKENLLNVFDFKKVGEG